MYNPFPFDDPKPINSCVDGLTCTDGRHIAITLICEYHLLGVHALDGCSNCASTTVSSLCPVDIDIVVCKYRATYR